MLKFFVIILILSFSNVNADGRSLEYESFFGTSSGFKGSFSVHIGVFNPQVEPIADVLYLHGYGDRFENHKPLFKSLTDAKMRVIAFDLPSHGRSKTGQWDDLNWWSFQDLADLVRHVEQETIETHSRPLILAGWSTGGLIAIRMAQTYDSMLREPSALVLFAPAVSVPICVGDTLCRITNRTLTHDKSLMDREISPALPLSRVNFASRLLYNASRSWEPLPENLPTLVWIAGDKEDRYVKSHRLKEWAAQQSISSENISAVQCKGAMHELDNETSIYGGVFVRDTSAHFIRAVINKSDFSFNHHDNCQPIK